MTRRKRRRQLASALAMAAIALMLMLTALARMQDGEAMWRSPRGGMVAAPFVVLVGAVFLIAAVVQAVRVLRAK